MADPQSSSPQKKTVVFPNLLIKGKIVKVVEIPTNNGKIYGHLINTPATGEYDHPGGAYVKASEQLGQVDEIVEILASNRRSSFKSDKGWNYNNDIWVEKSSESLLAIGESFPGDIAKM